MSSHPQIRHLYLTPRLGDLCEIRDEKIVSAIYGRQLQENRVLKTQYGTYEPKEVVTACIKPGQTPVRQNPGTNSRRQT